MLLIVNHDDAGVFRDHNRLTFYIADLPRPILLEIVQQKLVSIEDDQRLSHLLALFDFKAIVLLLSRHDIDALTITILLII